MKEWRIWTNPKDGGRIKTYSYLQATEQAAFIVDLKPNQMQTFPFKKILFATTFFIIPFSILESFLALFNIVSVDFNNVPRTGWFGFMIPILFIPFMGLMLGGFNWIVLNVGYWFYSLFFKSDKNSN